MSKTRGTNVLVQAVVDPKLAKRVEEAAKKEGLSVSSWIRRLLIQWSEKDVRSKTA